MRVPRRRSWSKEEATSSQNHSTSVFSSCLEVEIKDLNKCQGMWQERKLTRWWCVLTRQVTVWNRIVGSLFEVSLFNELSLEVSLEGRFCAFILIHFDFWIMLDTLPLEVMIFSRSCKSQVFFPASQTVDKIERLIFVYIETKIPTKYRKQSFRLLFPSCCVFLCVFFDVLQIVQQKTWEGSANLIAKSGGLGPWFGTAFRKLKDLTSPKKILLGKYRSITWE